jgi:hypothetical protein
MRNGALDRGLVEALLDHHRHTIGASRRLRTATARGNKRAALERERPDAFGKVNQHPHETLLGVAVAPWVLKSADDIRPDRFVAQIRARGFIESYPERTAHHAGAIAAVGQLTARKACPRIADRAVQRSRRRNDPREETVARLVWDPVSRGTTASGAHVFGADYLLGRDVCSPGRDVSAQGAVSPGQEPGTKVKPPEHKRTDSMSTLEIWTYPEASFGAST